MWWRNGSRQRTSCMVRSPWLNGVSCVFLRSAGRRFRNEGSPSRLSSLHAETLVISSEAGVVKSATRGLRIREVMPEVLSPIPYIIPAQLFSALLADVKGFESGSTQVLGQVTKTV